MGRGLFYPRRACAALSIAVAAATVMLPAAASPQEEAARGQGLDQFLADAMRRSPRLYAAQDAYDQATIGRELAASRFNSQITPFFSAGGEPYGPNGPTFGVNFQKMLPTGTTVRFRADSFGYDLGTSTYRDNGYTFWLSHPIIASFGPQPTYELTNARRGVDSAANQMRAARQRLVLEVAQTYFNIVRQQRLVEASRVALERAKKLRIASDARMQVGLATRLDVLRADLFTSQAQASLEHRRTALADAEDQLKLLTGRSMSSQLDIAGDDLDAYTSAYELLPSAGGGIVQRSDNAAGVPAPQATLVFAAQEQAASIAATVNAADDLRPFIATALGARIDVIEARARVDDADRAASVATWRLMPEINLNASYSNRGLWGPRAPGIPSFGNPFGGFSFGVTTSYNLDRTSERAAFSSASISVRAAERSLYELQERVTAEVRRAHRGILRAEKTIAIQSKAVDVSETQLRLAQLRYERGLADNFDVVDAESNVFDAQSALVSARVDRALAGLALDLSMGLIDPDRFRR